jgi:hypothetical protein
VRYEDAPGSGRTFALAHHATPADARRVALDCRAHSHKSLLLDCLEQCGATAPPEATIATLAAAAALSLQAAPTLLLLDNCEFAGPKLVGSLHGLLDTASAAAIAMTPPRSEDHTKDPLAPLRRRATRVELQPLSRETASALIRQIAPSIDVASAQTILQRSAGHAQTVAADAERVEAHGDEERHALESYHSPRLWLVVLIMLVAFIAIIYAQRHLVQNDVVAAVGTGVIAVTLWLLRPRFMKLTRPK